VVLDRSQQGMSRFRGGRAIFDAEDSENEGDAEVLEEGYDSRLTSEGGDCLMEVNTRSKRVPDLCLNQCVGFVGGNSLVKEPCGTHCMKNP
jgi:hypothetical protein